MVQALLDDYRSGVPSTRLSVRYSVSKSALLNLLHEEGLATRKSGLTSAQILLASQLREDGLSYDVIGRRFGVYGSTVWRALRP